MVINTIKGWLGEKVTAFGMWAHLDNKIYRRIDSLIIKASNGTTQIDHVLVSIYGVFVIETKNMKGWIFGESNGDRWTQVIYRKKSQFQNPLRQNYRHTKCLSEYLELDPEAFRSVVYFAGKCCFKTRMPPNVINSGLSDYIKEFRQETLSQEQVTQIESSLINLKRDRSLTRKAHLKSLRDRHQSTTICPRCGGSLVNRTAKKGQFAGETFLGCSNYPKCRYTKKV